MTDRTVERELEEALTRERQAHLAVQEVARRDAFLSEASRLMGDSLHLEVILDRVARLSVPAWADWCSFHLLDAERRLRMVAVAAKDPRHAAWGRGLLEWRHEVADRNEMASVIDNARSVALRGVPNVFLESAVPPEKRGESAGMPTIYSLVCAPLEARGCRFGALLLAYCDPTREFSAADRALAEELALRAAVAADNATLYQQANAAILAREEFIAIASHELRTPLAVLTLALEKLLRTLARQREVAPEELVRLGEATRNNVRRLTDLVESLLDARHVGDVRSSLVIQEVDLAAVVREVVERFESTAERAGCALDVRGADAVTYGDWDRIRVDQILTNLLANALKFGRGKPVEVSLETGAYSARLVVRDHGIGIAPGDLARIFERFERATPVTHYGGFGLGLYITKQLVEAHGGHIEVTSTVGDGATFTVELPRKSIAGDLCQQAAQAVEGVVCHGPPPTRR